MKKIAVIMQDKDAPSAVRSLRSLGAVHVENQAVPQGPDITSLRDDAALASAALAVLSEPEFSGKKCFENGKPVKDWKSAAKHVLESRKRLEQLEEFSAGMKGRIRAWERWGNFDPASVASLKESGVYARLYEIPVRDLDRMPEGVIIKRIFTSGGMTGCAAISGGDFTAPFKELELPAVSLDGMRARLSEDLRAAVAVKDAMIRHLCYKETFRRIKRALEKELELHEAVSGMGRSGAIAYITGYIPAGLAKRITDEAKKAGWGIVVNDPSEEDDVPTLIKNPGWVSLIEPVFKMLEIIPGYRELDVSPVFLVALALFFGMIIGDAGYGAVYIALTFFAQMTIGKKMKSQTVFRLLYLFSFFAVLWGFLTGTVFGQEWYIKAGMKPVLPILNDTKFLQALCFFLGALHLSIAHGWQAIRKAPSLNAIADIGWICVIWAAFFLARMLILGEALPFFTKWVIISGIIMVIIGTNPQRNVFKMIGSGLGNVALSIMNNFTDVVSYIRLFAVGLAGIAIADTVNTLASGLDNPAVKVLVVFAGHTINIILGPLSVLVNGVRLNVLEFSGHAGLTWIGTQYRPLEE